MDFIKAGGAAFPLTFEVKGPTIDPVTGATVKEGHSHGHLFPGMTLRDYFAAKAMAAVINMNYPMSDIGYTMRDGKSIGENYAICAYELADAMLAARGAT